MRASGDDYWYIFENRDNTIINYSEKIFGVVDICAPSRLAEAFRNALDGRTYKYPYPPSRKIGGITNMQQRAKLIDARFDIESVLGKGTTITVSTPL